MLHIAWRGRGPSIVLVHGFTQTGASWDPIAQALGAAGYRVAMVDAPGHGGSSQVRADLSLGGDLMVAAGGAGTYVGYSMGARFCLHAALSHPAEVQRLVLISATAGIEDANERAARRAADEVLAADLDAVGPHGLAGFLERWLANPLFATLAPEARNLDARLANTPEGLASSLRLAGTGTQEPLWSRLSQLQMPTLVVTGALDAKFTVIGRRLVEAIGDNAQLATLAKAGHAAHAECPDVFLDVLLAFLQR